MKTLTLAILSAAIILSSCSSTKKTTTSNGDDVYYNPGQEVEQAVTPVSEPGVTPVETISAESAALSDYERYRLQQEAQMLGETYEPEGSEALYVEQYQLTDSIVQGAVIGQETAPVIVNNYNYYTDPN